MPTMKVPIDKVPTKKMPTAKPLDHRVYQLKVTLKYTKPPIWRRIQVPADVTLYKLHQILQALMGWYDCHLHQFIVGEIYYGTSDPEFGMDSEMKSERGVRLNKIATTEKSKFVYEYDFGDSWQHEILVEKILPQEEGAHYPICLTGKRACPPEDVGGVWGYEGFLEAIRDPKHPEHDSMLQWAGGSFDPEAFDLEGINVDLKLRV